MLQWEEPDALCTPVFPTQGSVRWQDEQRTQNNSQQLCDFAFQRRYEHIERSLHEHTAA